MDYYNSRAQDEGKLPGILFGESPKTVDELIENYLEFGIRQRSPDTAMLPRVVANMKNAELFLKWDIEGGKNYKVSYTQLSPRLFGYRLFEFLLADLTDEEKALRYLSSPQE
jgi:hypothetical protein